MGLISGRDSTDLCGGSLQPGPLLQVTPGAHPPWSKGSHLPELHLSNEGLRRAGLVLGPGAGDPAPSPAPAELPVLPPPGQATAPARLLAGETA